jgi:hypothetical protein
MHQTRKTLAADHKAMRMKGFTLWMKGFTLFIPMLPPGARPWMGTRELIQHAISSSVSVFLSPPTSAPYLFTE